MTPGGRGRPLTVIAATVVLVCGDVEVLSWPLAWRAHGDLAVVDDLARLELAARRLGLSVRLRDAHPELSELLELCGLGGVLLGPGRQVGGQAEGGEQPGVEEVVVPDNPVA